MKMEMRKRLITLLRWPVLVVVVLLMTAVWPGTLRADDHDDLGFVPDQVVVKLNIAAGATIETINAAYGTTTLEMLLGSAGIYLLQVNGQDVEGVVDEMVDDPRLLYAEPNFVGEMPEGGPSGTWGWGGYDPNPYLNQYAADLINLAEAHAVSLGEGVIVAVMDTGVQLDHPHLAGLITAAGYDYIDDDPVADDEQNNIDDDGDGLIDEGTGHGTHVAGIVSLVAPSAQIMPLRVLDSDGRGNDFMIAEAIQFARANGASIINMSLGTPVESELLEDIIADAAASGVVIVAAAGNLNSNTEMFPAAYADALAVTSVGPESVKSDFANYGEWVGIAAPGESITSTFPVDGYAQWSGTSMATGFVSGQAALIRSVQPGLNAADISWLIQSTAQPVDSFNPGYAGLLGMGVADVGASVTTAYGTDCGAALTLSADADAWIEQNSPSNNKGDDSTLKVKSQGSGDNFRLLVRFGLPGSIPSGCMVESAVLRLYSDSPTNGRTLEAFSLAGDWSEMGVNWGNQPSTTGTAAVTAAGSGYLEWDMAGQVQAMLDSAANHGFLMRDTAENGPGAEQQFNSREKDEYPPQLVISFAPGGPSGSPLPGTTFLSTPAVLSAETSAIFSFESNDSGARFDCSLDGGSFAACFSPHVVSDLGIGTHTFAVRAIGDSGTADPTPATFTWTITPPLLPTTVSCGQILTTNTLVLNDLLDCPGDGLVIGAAGIYIDLNGRTLDGVGLGSGILNNGFNDVTIYNGVVQEFDYGVLLNGGTAGNVVSNLTIQLNQEAAIELVDADEGGAGNTLSANTITGNGGGIRLSNGTSFALIEGNILSGNSIFGLHLDNAGYNRIEGNVFNGSDDSAVILDNADFNHLSGNNLTGGADTFILLQAGSNNNRLEANSLSEGGDGGIAVIDSDGSELTANTIHNMSDAAVLLVNSHGSLVQGNDLRWNATGVEMDGGTGNRIKSNNASNSGGPGIVLENNALDNLISLNIASNNAGNGIFVDVEIPPDSPLPGNVIAYNTAANNDDDGLVVNKAGHTLIGNVAQNNAGWGIYAELGVIDGGGNVAGGNVESQQCFNFVCNGGAPLPDITPPETVIESGPAAETTDSSAVFSFSTNEAEATFLCSLNGGAYTSCTSPLTIQNLSPGSHTFGVLAVDAAENADPTPAGYSWTVSAPLDCGPAITVFAGADAWIEQNSPGSNKGDDSTLKVKAQSSNDNFRTLVRFDLPPGIPADCVVESATLKLYASSWRTGRTLQAFRLASGWSEMGVTWGSQPATVGTAATTSSGGGYRSWNLTNQVQAMMDAGAFHGFLIRDANESGSGREQSFHSREHDEKRPVLVITLVPAGG